MASRTQRKTQRDDRQNRRRRLKWRIAIGAVALLCLAGTFLAEVPLRFRNVPPYVAKVLREQFGLEVEISAAELWCLPPRLVLEKARVRPEATASAGDELSAERVQASLNPLWWLFGMGKPLRAVHIISPGVVRVRMEHGALHWPPGIQALAEQFSTQKKKEGAFKVPISLLEIRRGEIVVYQGLDRMTALPMRSKSQSYETTVAAVQISNLQVRELSGERYAVQCTGLATVREAPSPFTVRGTFLGTSEFAGELESPTFRAYWPMGFRGSVATEARDTRLDVRMLRRENQWDFVTNVSVSALALSMPTHSIAYQDENVQLALRGAIEFDSRQLTLTKARIESPQIRLEAEGRGNWEQQEYEANLSADHIGAPYIELLNAPLPKGFEVTAGNGAVQANLHVAGAGPELRTVVGKLTFSSVTLHTPHLRRPVRELKGELDFEPRRLVFHELAGQLGKAALTVNGELVGDYLTSRTGTLRLRWESQADARELTELVQSAGGQVAESAESITPLGGSIYSEGSLEQPVEGDPGAWPAPKMVGVVRVQDLAFRQKSMPAPVTDANGELRVQNSTVIIDGLRAKFGASDVRLVGSIAGDRYFWKDPEVSVTLQLSADAAAFVASLEPTWRNQVSAYRPSGKLAASVQCDLRLSDWQHANLRGNASLSQLAFEFVTDYVSAKLENLSADIGWDGKRLTLKSFSGAMNGIQANGTGSLDQTRIAVRLNATGNLEQVQQLLPRMEPFVEIHGPAAADVTVEIAEPTLAADSKLQNELFRLLASLGPRVLRAYQGGRLQMNGRVVAGDQAKGASFRHHAMPPARTLSYGISVPRGEIKDIHGSFVLRGTTIEVPENAPLRCAMADTPNCRLWGSIAMVPNHYPKIKFQIETPEEAHFDTWITGWSADFHPPARRSPPAKGKRFELEGTIVAARGTYKGESVGQCSGELVYTFVSGEPPRRTEFRNIFIQGFGGSMRGYGAIESWREKPDDYPRWEANVQLDHVRIPPLSRWVFQNPRLVEGVLTGKIKLSGVKTDVQRLRGEGRVGLVQVEAGRLPFILKLFQVVNLTQTRGLFEKAAYNSKRDARFQIADGVVMWDKVELETEGLLLELYGRYYLEDHRIDAQVRLNLFESSLLGAIPLVDELARMADRTLGKVIMAFRVSGPAAQPSVTPIPLPLFQSPTP